ncbi:MAG: efflux RND transporter periplasmic adaptor subunit [Lachnospiraceae bacterium]|nr:efflux RND transporter periplasmic adaptor subunit [Lachnospiraceae bacterium]
MKKSWKGILAATLTIVVSVGMGACGKSSDAGSQTAQVQSVGDLCGIATMLGTDRFSGVVTSGKEKTITRDSSRKIGQVCVSKGDDVAEGQILFIYDAQSTKDDLEKAQLELQQMQNTLTARQAERNQLAADKKKAKATEQLDYNIQIAEADTDIREQQYNIGLKQKDIDKLNTLLTNLDVKAPFAGRVESIGSTGDDSKAGDASGDLATTDAMSTAADTGSDSSTGTGFIKIVETDQVRVKGTVNEMQMGMVAKDMSMIIRSRTDNTKTWTGTVESIETNSPEADNNTDMMYDGGTDTSNQSSKYAFYVSLPNHDGLLIGQHVYIEPDMGQGDASSQEIRLSASFIQDADKDPWVWAEDAKGLLEKRSVKLGDYDSAADTCVVTEGLTADDFIAYPDDSYTVGMPCVEGTDEAADSTMSFDGYGGDVMSGAVMGEGMDAMSDGSYAYGEDASASGMETAEGAADDGTVIGGANGAVG